MAAVPPPYGLNAVSASICSTHDACCAISSGCTTRTGTDWGPAYPGYRTHGGGSPGDTHCCCAAGRVCGRVAGSRAAGSRAGRAASGAALFSWAAAGRGASWPRAGNTVALTRNAVSIAVRAYIGFPLQ